MTTTLPNGSDTQAATLIVVRTRVVRLPVEDLLDTILAALIGSDKTDPHLLRSEETLPELVLEASPAADAVEAEKLLKDMVDAHLEVGDRQRVKVVQFSEASEELRELAALPPYPQPGSAIPDMPGYVVGECEHRVARSEWRAGFRTCERCPRQADTAASAA